MGGGVTEKKKDTLHFDVKIMYSYFIDPFS